jgi:hypothetical protein
MADKQHMTAGLNGNQYTCNKGRLLEALFSTGPYSRLYSEQDLDQMWRQIRYLHHSPVSCKKQQEHSSRKYKWTPLSLGDINDGT